ncbi:multiple sugar transport system substrate-binding protein [Kibdelosporangium banguiense]|uniref:Multiple sugar transport system substrate-binding protein n=1 Tax=Kibdelosporangium banguiense TaxID=1365924 RepID=A0ABS4TSQ6_9PSEU|nr:ABC transporter substrate-binding protein [Kibdelosporangium banguiense]MBP2327442.1 multiple sugar transport system substrate-binding protein [Kibdelosporangium banguiense]
MVARRLGRAAIAALVLSPLLTACGSDSGGGAGENVTISFAWWGSDGRATITKQAVELFQQRNPTIKVDTTFSAYAAYWEKVATQTAGGNPPDVMNVDFRYLAEYGERKVLLDLNEGAGKQISLADVNPELANTGVIGGKRYAVPWAQNASSLVYDPAAYTAAGADPSKPMTWEQFRAAAEKVSAAGGNSVRGVTDFGMIDSALEIWLRQRGKAMFTPDGKLGFGAGELREYWELADKFRTTKAATEADVTASYNTSPEQSPLGKKLTSAEFAYDSVYPGFQKANGKDLKVAPYPSDDASNTGQYRRPSMFLAVSARGKAQEASAKLVNFLINDPEAGKILGADRGLPPNLKVRAQLAGAATGTNKVIFDYEAEIEPRLGPAPAVPPKGAGAIQKLLQRTYEEIAFGRLTVDAAVDRFMSEAQKDLK